MKYKSIKIDLNRDEILASYSKSLLNDFYMRDYEKSPQEAYARAAYAWSTYKGKTEW